MTSGDAAVAVTESSRVLLYVLRLILGTFFAIFKEGVGTVV